MFISDRLSGFCVLGLTYSPVKGPEGNIEYLVFLEKKTALPEEIISLTEHEAERMLAGVQAEGADLCAKQEWKENIRNIVEQAHEALEKDGKQG